MLPRPRVFISRYISNLGPQGHTDGSNGAASTTEATDEVEKTASSGSRDSRPLVSALPTSSGLSGSAGKQAVRSRAEDATATSGGLSLWMAENAAAERAQGIATTIDPASVRFSQSSIDRNFGAGGSIGDLAASLRSGALKPNDIPPIRLVERDGHLFTLDNRRLEAFRRAGVAVPYRMATSEEAEVEAWKFTTQSRGTTIRVRGE